MYYSSSSTDMRTVVGRHENSFGRRSLNQCTSDRIAMYESMQFLWERFRLSLWL
jgi:hypothetical protein